VVRDPWDDGWGDSWDDPPPLDAPRAARVRTQIQRNDAPRYAPHNDPALHMGKGGRTKAPRTVVAYEMQMRNIRQGQVVGLLRCSPRAWQNYVARRRPFPGFMLAALCTLLVMDEEELVDDDHYLKELETDDRGLPIGP
jgi:hypothetical protein